MGDALLVVGLGNPGPEYEQTRHNIGFVVVDHLADRFGVSFKYDRAMRIELAEARVGERRVILAKPQTFMNLSGEAVRAVATYFKIEFTDIIAVHDEVDLPLGEVRIKRGGGEGGHNGLRSLSKHFGTKDYLRVRCGVGRPPGSRGTSDHVLAPFGARERDDVGAMIDLAESEIAALIERGPEAIEAERAKQAPKSRRIKLHVEVSEPIEAAWDRWTTPVGITSFFAPACSIGTEPGEPYEIYMDPREDPGNRGSEGCEIITSSPPSRFAFTWNAPPEVPELRAAGEHTRVNVLFKRKGAERTLVTLTHTGWGSGEAWDRCYAYFEEAWPVVLSRLEAVCAGRVVEWTRGDS